MQNNKNYSCKIVFYELGIPFRPNTLVDITPYIEAKKNAIEQIEYGIKKPGNIVKAYCIFSPVCILWL